MHQVPRLSQPNRTLVVPLLAAALGAVVATATFALVNIEDQASVSLPAVQSVAPSGAVAAVRTDGGPEEGTAQQNMGSESGAAAALRTDGGPEEGAAQQNIRSGPDLRDSTAYWESSSPRSSYQPASAAARPDGGPNEASTADALTDTQPPKPGATAQP